MSGRVDDLDLEGFTRDGFLVVPRFVEPSRCEEMIVCARALVEAFEPATVSIFRR